MKILLFLLSEKFFHLLLFLLVILLSGFYLTRENRLNLMGRQDWDQRYVYSESSRRSIVESQQLPLWNAYHCGGMTQIGNPQNDFISPNFLAILFFGPVVGYKFLFMVYLVIGLFGFYHLGKHHRISGLGSAFLACTYMLSGLMILPFAVGMTAFLNIALLPWLYFFYLKALEEKNLQYVLLSALTLAAFFLNGFHYFPLLFVFLGVVTLLDAFSTKNWKPFFIFTISLVIFLPLVAVKLYPSLETISNNSHFTRENREFTSGYSLKSLTMALLSTDQSFGGFYNWGQLDQPSFLDSISYMIDESGMYVGIVGVGLFLIGLFKQRKNRQLIILFIFFLLLGFGLNIRPSLFQMLHSLPLIENMRVAQRYRYFFMIPFVLFIGYGFDYLFAKSKEIISGRKLHLFLIIAFALTAIFHQALVNLNYFSTAFESPQPEVKKRAFVQSCGAWENEFSYLSEGYGLTDCSDPILIKVASRCNLHDEYQGEYYWVKEGDAFILTQWSQNKLTFNTSVKNKNRLIINQNFDPGWKAMVNDKDKIKVENNDGLLAVDLYQQHKKVSLYYLPDSFIIGAVISFTTLVIALIFITRRAKKINSKQS